MFVNHFFNSQNIQTTRHLCLWDILCPRKLIKHSEYSDNFPPEYSEYSHNSTCGNCQNIQTTRHLLKSDRIF